MAAGSARDTGAAAIASVASGDDAVSGLTEVAVSDAAPAFAEADDGMGRAPAMPVPFSGADKGADLASAITTAPVCGAGVELSAAATVDGAAAGAAAGLRVDTAIGDGPFVSPAVSPALALGRGAAVGLSAVTAAAALKGLATLPVSRVAPAATVVPMSYSLGAVVALPEPADMGGAGGMGVCAVPVVDAGAAPVAVAADTAAAGPLAAEPLAADPSGAGAVWVMALWDG